MIISIALLGFVLSGLVASIGMCATPNGKRSGFNY